VNPNIKNFQDFDMRQKIAQFGVQTAGNVVTVGVMIFLFLAWVLTSPLIQLFDQVAGKVKVKTNNK
jgi:hypothetical protein